MDEIAKAGLDIDQGRVLKFIGAIYYGPDLQSPPSRDRIKFSLHRHNRNSVLLTPASLQ
jgi:hypothetical protein